MIVTAQELADRSQWQPVIEGQYAFNLGELHNGQAQEYVRVDGHGSAVLVLLALDPSPARMLYIKGFDEATVPEDEAREFAHSVTRQEMETPPGLHFAWGRLGNNLLHVELAEHALRSASLLPSDQGGPDSMGGFRGMPRS